MLGGTSSDISDDCSFASGEGIYIVSDTNMKDAISKTASFKKELGMDDYSINIRRAYEDRYLGQISGIMGCIFQNNKNENVRVGQAYYALHPSEVGKRVYN